MVYSSPNGRETSYPKHIGKQNIVNIRKISALATVFLLAGLAAPLLGVSAGTETHPRIVHVFVALADNKNQGIVPVPARLGNGQDPANNLYWGAAFGVKTYFKKSAEWKVVSCAAGPVPAILERCVFRRSNPDGYLIADAYDGARIREAIQDFLKAAAGRVLRTSAAGSTEIASALKDADLVVYVGHDGLMDFQVPAVVGAKDGGERQFIILACASKPYFQGHMKQTGSEPLLWTTSLMAPEAYTLDAALKGWFAGENAESIRMRAARAYDQYQKCGERSARRLFASGW